MSSQASFQLHEGLYTCYEILDIPSTPSKSESKDTIDLIFLSYIILTEMVSAKESLCPYFRYRCKDLSHNLLLRKTIFVSEP